MIQVRTGIVIAVAVSVLANPGCAADSRSVDGSYSGPQTVTFGTAPECGADSQVSVAVQGAGINYGFGAFPLKLKVADSGAFAGRARKGNRGGGQVIRAKGRISDAALEADLVVHGVHGRVCSYHWSLKKAGP